MYMSDICKSYRTEAERLHFALEIGIESPESIIQWADEIIRREKEPSYEIIQVSLANPGDSKTLKSLLESLGSVDERANAVRCTLGRLAFLARRDTRLLRSLSKQARWSPFDVSELLDDFFINNIYEDYALAEEGVLGSVEHLDREFQSYLNQFETERSASSNWYYCRGGL